MNQNIIKYSPELLLRSLDSMLHSSQYVWCSQPQYQAPISDKRWHEGVDMQDTFALVASSLEPDYTPLVGDAVQTTVHQIRDQ